MHREALTAYTVWWREDLDSEPCFREVFTEAEAERLAAIRRADGFPLVDVERQLWPTGSVASGQCLPTHC